MAFFCITYLGGTVWQLREICPTIKHSYQNIPSLTWKAESFLLRQKRQTSCVQNCAAKFLFANSFKGSNFLTGK